MTTTQLILLLLLVVVVVLAVFWLMRRGSAKEDAQRVEAEELRGRAQEIAAAIGGQQTFAEQAEERAAVAKAEAEARAAEATRLEEEAAAQRAVVAETQREYEAQMRRADEIDPDVKESAYAAPGEGGAAPAAVAEPVAAPAAPAEHDATDEEPQTRAERRAAREQAGADGPRGAHAAPAAAAGAAGAGASAWGAREHESDDHADSERVASAADYRDDVAPEGDRPVSEPAAMGTAAGMADEKTAPTRDDDEQTDLSHDTATPSGEWGGPRDPERDADEADRDVDTGRDDDAVPTGAAAGAALGTGAAGVAAASTAAERRDDDVTGSGGDDTEEAPADAASHDTDLGDGVTIIADIEEYAATEPVLAEDQTPPVQRDGDATTGAAALAEADEQRSAAGEAATTSGSQGHEPSTVPASEHDDSPTSGDGSGAATASDGDEDLGDEAHAKAEAGAQVAASAEDEGAATREEDPYDTTPERDWAADEGELLEKNSERADALEEERHALDADGSTQTPTHDEPATDAGAERAGDDAGVSDTDSRAERAEEAATGTEDLPSQADEGPGERAARRISGFDELRDGGYGVGSAATLDDGAQPLDHAVAGYRESMTFRSPGDAGYDDTDPDVWFYDEAAAERNGFRRAEG